MTGKANLLRDVILVLVISPVYLADIHTEVNAGGDEQEHDQAPERARSPPPCHH